MSSNNPDELKEQLEQQQQLIGQLKDVVRTNQLSIQEKERLLQESAVKLSRLKLHNKAKQISANVKQLDSAHEDEPKTDNAVPKNEVNNSDKLNKGKLLVLKKKLEENKIVFEKREQDLDLAKRNFEITTANLEQQLAERDAQLLRLKYNSENAANIEEQMVRFKEMYDQIVRNDQEILGLNETVQTLEKRIYDLEENVKEKEEVIQARNKAIQCLSEDMSKRSLVVADHLDDAREEMRQMQEAFVQKETQWKAEREELNRKLGDQLKNFADNENKLSKLENTKFELSTRNAILQETMARVHEDNEDLKRSLDERHSEQLVVLHQKEEHINDLLKELESLACERSVIQNKCDQMEVQLADAEKSLCETRENSFATTELKDRLNFLERENKQLATSFAERLEQQTQQFDSQAQGWISERNDFELRISDLTEQNCCMSNSYQQLKNEFDALSLMFNSVCLDETKLQEQRKGLLDTIGDLKTYNSELTEKFEGLDADYNSLKKDFETCNNILSEFQSLERNLRAELVDKAVEIQALVAENDSKSAYIIQMQNSVGQGEQLTSELEHLRNETLSLGDDREALQSQLQQRIIELDEQVKNNTICSLRLSELETQLQVNYSQAAELSSSKMILASQNSSLLEENKQLQQNLEMQQNSASQVKMDNQTFITSISANLDSLQADNKLLIDEKSSLVLQIQQAMTDINALQETVDQNNKAISVLMDELKNLGNEKMDLLNELQAKEELVSSLSLEAKQHQQMMRTLEQQVEHYCDELVQKDQFAENQNVQINILQETLSDEQEKFQLILSQLRENESKENEQLQKDNTEHQQLQSELSALQSAYSQLESVYVQKCNDLAALDNSIKIATDAKYVIQSDLDSCKLELSAKTKHLEVMGMENTILQSKIDSLLGNTSDGNNTLEQMHQQLKTVNAEKTKFQALVVKLKAALTKLKNERAESESKLNNLVLENSNLQLKLDESVSSIMNSSGDFKGQSCEHEGIRDHMLESQLKISQLQDSFEDERNSFVEVKVSLEQRLLQSQDEILQLKKSLHDNQEMQKQSLVENQGLNEQIDHLRQEISSCQEQYKSLQSTIQSLEDEIKQMDQEGELNRLTISKLQGEIKLFKQAEQLKLVLENMATEKETIRLEIQQGKETLEFDMDQLLSFKLNVESEVRKLETNKDMLVELIEQLEATKSDAEQQVREIGIMKLDLQDELQSMRVEKENLHLSLEDFKHNRELFMCDCDDKRASLLNELDKFDQKKQGLEIEVCTLTYMKDSLLQQIQQLETELDKLSEKHCTVEEGDVENLSDQNQQLQQILHNKQIEQEKLISSNFELREQHFSLEQAHLGLQDTFDQCSEELRSCKLKLATLEQSYTQLQTVQSQVEQMKERLVCNADDIKRLTTSNECEKQESNSLRTNLKQLQIDYARLCDDFSLQSQKLVEYESQNKKVLIDNQNLLSVQQSLQSELDHYKNTVVHSMQQEEYVNCKVSELQQDCDEKRRTILDLQKLVEDNQTIFNSKHSNALSSYEKLSKEFEVQLRNLERLEELAAQLEGKLVAKEDQLVSLKTVMKEMGEQLSDEEDLKQRLSGLQLTNEQLQMKINQLQQENDVASGEKSDNQILDFSLQLQEKESNIKDLVLQIESFNTLVDDLNRKVWETEANFEFSNKDNDHLTAENDNLKTKLMELNRHSSRLAEQVTVLENANEQLVDTKECIESRLIEQKELWEHKMEKLQKQLNESRVEFKNLQLAYQVLDSRSPDNIDSVKAECQELREANTNLQMIVEKRESDYLRLQKDLEVYASSFDGTEPTIVDFKDQKPLIATSTNDVRLNMGVDTPSVVEQNLHTGRSVGHPNIRLHTWLQGRSARIQHL